jgi:predicted phage terminase large subunit-like protein
MTQDLVPELTAIERSGLKTGTFVDLAASTKTRADFTAIATCGIDQKENIYILNILRGRWEWPDAREHIIEEILFQGVRLAGVESQGYQLSSFQELARDRRLRHVALHPVPVDRDKVSRALLLSARGAAGKLFCVRASWFEDLVYEFTNFPGGDHDDQVDAVTGCVELINKIQAAAPVVRPAVIRGRSKWRGRG